MHIAYLTPEYPHELCPASGGLGSSIKNMAEALVEKGVQVSIILYGQEIDKHFDENGLRFYFIKQKSYQVGGWYLYRKYLQGRINRIIKKETIDLIEAPDWTGITAFMKFEVPLLIRMNGTDAYFCALENRKQKFKNRFFEREAMKNANRILAVSDFTGRKTMEVLKLNRGYEVIPNSISIEDFKPSENNPEPNRILYFGSIIRKKGVLELAEIFNEVAKQYKEAKLLLAGRDVVDIFENVSTWELFKGKLSKEAAKQFEYIGSLDYSMVRKEIEKANVVVLPSFAEALPMTWLEAMAMEKALVTSNIGWAPEVMIDGETGFTVDPRDHQLYAEKILQLLKDKNLAGNMGKAARKRVEEKFSTEVVAEKNIRFYEEVLQKWKNSSINN
ncbi:glycosyltransferase family 1 protein [Christiangramia fulva]|uniref:Glycosyltransferase family 1 protein n=1 Tax=Christiangramia fulva TaxID=2126553 RepID=A0A2R3Z0N4_9FLAO|nr:glycosyltransferase family 4 protein [Christiangramia fulva]AVR43819.1 glycosyltransferase family 1 protein [Christiangramia fulva]